ncbi:MAG: long-chain acyl-CoA synthetase [Glaciecola sp.]|jgi:long-subunit acyl-CoA synthetase (AMP-forming)
MINLTPLASFSKLVQQHPDKPYLHQPINRQLKIFSWSDVDDSARRIAFSLQKMGLSKGDKIGILSKNCAEWFIADLAIMMAGMISVPIYYTANRETIQYIIEESNTKAIFVGKLDGLVEAREGIAQQIPIITFPYPSISGQYSWQLLLENQPLEHVHAAELQDTMTLVYTSGSTGRPKGVVTSYQNLAAAALETAARVKTNANDHVLSYLPLAHITERSVVENLSFYSGFSIFFVESLDTFIDDLKVAQPNVFGSVPRLWTKFQGEILNQIPDNKLQLLLKIPIIKQVIARKIRISLGLNNARMFFSGTAPISPGILQWYERIGISISEAWGMTETSGMSCVNYPYQAGALGSIGKPIACVEMKIGDSQEILIRGAAVFKKYYKNDEATNASFIGGWFRTGDVGVETLDGDFKVIGRIKEQFKTAKGKYVAPVPIESLLGRNLEIEQVCVFGQGRKQPIALVVIHSQNKQSNSFITQSLLTTLNETNSKLESHQTLDHLIILKSNWTIENNLLTPTLKIKRKEIEANFKHYLTEPLAEKIIWES